MGTPDPLTTPILGTSADGKINGSFEIKLAGSELVLTTTCV